MPVIPKITNQLFRVIIALLTISDHSYCSSTNSMRDLKSMRDAMEDTPIHTNTQACIPQETPSNGVQLIVAFVVGMFVMFAAACAFNQCNPKQNHQNQPA